MRTWPAAVLLVALTGVGSAGSSPPSAEYVYHGPSAYHGEFSASCQASGFTVPLGLSSLSLMAARGHLHVRQAIVNKTVLLAPPNDIEVQPYGQTVIRQETSNVPPGPISIQTGAAGLVVGLPFEYSEGGTETVRVSWTVGQAEFGAAESAAPTSAGEIWLQGPEGPMRHQIAFPQWTRLAHLDGASALVGNFSLYLRDVTVTTDGSEAVLGRYDIETENETTPIASRTVHRLTDAFLDLVDARMDLPSGAQPACTSMEGRLAGRLTAQAATGRAPSSNGTFMFDDRVIELEGDFSIREDMTPGASGTEGNVRVSARGDVRLAALDFLAVPTTHASDVPAAALGLGALLLGILGVALRHAGTMVGVFYSRFGKDEALDNKKRDLVHDAVRANPAMDLSELAGITGLHRTTVFYHVQVLERVGLVSTLRHGRSVRVLGKELRNNQDLARLLTAKDHRYGYLAQLLQAGPRPLREIAPLLSQQFGLSRRAAYHAIKGALRFGIVRQTLTRPEVVLACANT